MLQCSRHFMYIWEASKPEKELGLKDEMPPFSLPKEFKENGADLLFNGPNNLPPSK